MKLIVNSDGGSKGNPGPAGYGVIIKNEAGKFVTTFGEYIGIETNNVAEYYGAINGVQKAIALGASEIELRTDSQLVAYQYLGQYKIKNSRLAPFFFELRELVANVDFVMTWVSRENNQLADKECNNAIQDRRYHDPRGNHISATI
jgi:ribonuclease HI